MADEEEWTRLVCEFFGFLRKYDFEISGTAETWWATTVAFTSPVHAVLVTRNREYERVEMELAVLEDSAVPDVHVWIDPGAGTCKRTLFDNVVEARAPYLLPTLKKTDGLTLRMERRALGFLSNALLEVVPDFLSGSDACMGEAHAMAAGRVRDEPQELKVVLPSTATAEEEAAAVEDARRTVPPYVQVVVERYRAPRHSGPK